MVAALALFAAAPALAAKTPIPVPPGLSDEDQALLRRAIDYLQGLATAQGRFTQTDQRGAVSNGAFTLQRPGKARFDYDPPSGLQVASDGHKVTVINHRLKTIQAYPLGATPLALFLAKDIRFDKGVTIDQITHQAGAFTVVAREGRKKSAGQIALTFAEAPLALTGWVLTDEGGGEVRVRLTDFHRTGPHPGKFFDIYDPSLRQTPGT